MHAPRDCDMIAYIVRRSLQNVLLLIGLTVFLFVLFRVQVLVRCNAGLVVPSNLTVSYYQGCLEQFGLDKPLPLQYVHWLGLAVHGDFGKDSIGTPVVQAIVQRLPRTVILVGASLILQEAIALLVGIVTALKRSTILDRLVAAISYLGLALPTFWLSLLIILIFAVKLAWLPPGGVVSTVSSNPIVDAIPAVGSLDYWRYVLAHPIPTLTDLGVHLILPAFALAFAGIAADGHLMRTLMLKELRTDYVRTARAKGLPSHSVVLKHALRNALLPMITKGSLLVPALFSGAAVVETIFAWGGVGQYFVTELQHQDYNALLVILLFTGLLTLLANLAADLMYGIVDPRIQYQYE